MRPYGIRTNASHRDVHVKHYCSLPKFCFLESSELLATGPLNRWEYGELMPTIGVGLAPIAQRVILPLLQLWFVQRQIIGGSVA